MRTAFVIAALFLPASVCIGQEAEREKYRPMIDKGLGWLVKQQMKDGEWSDNSYNPAATTAVAGIALLADGNTTSQGTYRDNVKKAVGWFLKQKPKAELHQGLLCDPEEPRNSGRYMLQHGLAMSFLAKAYSEEEDRDTRLAVRDRLNAAVAFAVKGQSSRGAWFYTSKVEGHDSDENVATMLVLQGLLDAREAGIAVPRDALKKAWDHLKACTTEKGGITYSGPGRGIGGLGRPEKAPAGGERPTITAMALAAVMARGDGGLEEHQRRWLAFCADSAALKPDTLRDNFDLLPTCFFCKVVYHNTERHWKLAAGDKKLPEHMVWKSYRTAAFAHLQCAQREDGAIASKSGWALGPNFNTALALNILLYEDSVPSPISR
jgi:hypothetical protein